MMDKVKNEPALRFHGFDDSWQHTQIGALGELTGGGTPSTSVAEFWKGNIPWVSSSDLVDDNINYIRQYRFITKEAIAKSATKLIPADSILIVSRVGVGKVAINKTELCTSQDFQSLSPKDDNHIFLAYLIQLKTKELIELNQGTSIKGFVKSELASFKLSIPSLPEQQKIASFLTAVDDKIQQLSKKKALLEQYKKGVMQQLFSQKLRFKDEQGNEFPDWEEKQLKDVLIERKTRNADAKITEVFSVAKHKGVINQIEHLGRSYASSDISNYKVVEPNDIIYTKSPTSDFPYGIIKQNKTERCGVVSVLYAVLRPLNKHIGFIIDCYFSSSVNTYNYLNPLVQKGAKNTMNIGNSDFLNGAPLSLPTSELEQTKTTSFLSAIDDKINSINQQIEHTRQFKKGLLQQMFV